MLYYTTIFLTDLVDARTVYEEDPATERMEAGVFIPYDKNSITITPKGRAMVTFAARPRRETMSKGSHEVAMIFPKEVRERRKSLGFEWDVVVGYMRPGSNSKTE